MNLNDLYEMRDSRDAYQRDVANSTSGFGKNSQAYRADGGANDERHDLDQQSSTWYIRLNGKLIRDKSGNPYSFQSKAAANKAALTMQAKLFNKDKEFMLTTNPNDKQQSVTEGDDYSAVTSAITRRIITQHPEVLAKYGPAIVGQAIDEIADFVGDVDEIGSSDVSGWVSQVIRSLGRFAPVRDEGVEEGWKGALAGGLAGAALGSVAPGFGTIPMAALGAYAGHKLGDEGFKDPDAAYKKAQKLKQQQNKGVAEAEVDEAQLATMRDYFAGDVNAKDKTKIAQMKDYFSKNDPAMAAAAKATAQPGMVEAEVDSDGYSMDHADSGEYDYEGDQAKDQLNTIVRAARRLNGMLDDNENMPEWVQMKITNAADYIDTAADYIESNQEPELAEDNQDDLDNHPDNPKNWGGDHNDHAMWDEKHGVAEGEKIGNMDADRFDAALARMKKLAGAGPMKTVWDPAKRVYKNIPTAVQPRK
jgi:hypothetical protein